MSFFGSKTKSMSSTKIKKFDLCKALRSKSLMSSLWRNGFKLPVLGKRKMMIWKSWNTWALIHMKLDLENSGKSFQVLTTWSQKLLSLKSFNSLNTTICSINSAKIHKNRLWFYQRLARLDLLQALSKSVKFCLTEAKIYTSIWWSPKEEAPVSLPVSKNNQAKIKPTNWSANCKSKTQSWPNYSKSWINKKKTIKSLWKNSKAKKKSLR